MRYPDSFQVTTPTDCEIEIVRDFHAPIQLRFLNDSRFFDATKASLRCAAPHPCIMNAAGDMNLCGDTLQG